MSQEFEIEIEKVESGFILTHVRHPYGDTGGYGKTIIPTFDELTEFLKRYFLIDEAKK